MIQPQLLTRGEVALMLNVSCRVIAANEQAWGLDRFRIQLNARVIRYDREGVALIISRLKRGSTCDK